MNSQYYMPVKVMMDDNCVRKNGSHLAALGKKALIVTGTYSAKANGSLADITSALTANSQTFVVFDKVKSNPDIACAYEGAAFAKESGADFVIAIGGGSPMDAAKAIALLARQDISEENLFSGSYTADVLPMAFVPTTAGTGSEVTPYSILTNDRLQTKTSLASPYLYPKLAFLDAKYMEGLSYATTIHTAVDALSHSVEGMLSNRAGVVSDALAEKSIRLIASCFEALQSRTLTAEHRSRLLYGSLLGGMVIANTGTTAVHSMGYSLTYFKEIDHGRANGLLLGEFLAYAEKSCPARIQTILSCMDMHSVEEFCKVMDGLLGEKETLTAEEAERFASLAFKTKNIANCIVTVTEQDLKKMLESLK